MKTYKKVYFRITTPLYNHPSSVGFNTNQDSETFHTEATKIFLNDGWQLKDGKFKIGCSCNRVIKGKQELYLHPQSFSGVVLEENISYIEQLLNNNNILRFEGADVYEEVFDITDDEYINILKSKRQDIETDILEAYKTKRSNLYIIGTSTVERVIDKYRIKRLSQYSGVYSSSNIDWKFIEEVFENLVKENKIVTAQTKKGKGYRTDKKLLEKKITA